MKKRLSPFTVIVLLSNQSYKYKICTVMPKITMLSRWTDEANKHTIECKYTYIYIYTSVAVRNELTTVISQLKCQITVSIFIVTNEITE